jgi:hypothetical protein
MYIVDIYVYIYIYLAFPSHPTVRRGLVQLLCGIFVFADVTCQRLEISCYGLLMPSHISPLNIN